MKRNLTESPYQIPSRPEALYLRNYDDSFLEIIKDNAEQGGRSLQDRVNTFFKKLEPLNYEFRIIDGALTGFGFEWKERNLFEKVKNLFKMDSEIRLDEFTRLVIIVIDNMKQNKWHTSEVPWTLYCQGSIEVNSKRKLPISQNTRIFKGAKPGSIYERIVFDEQVTYLLERLSLKSTGDWEINLPFKGVFEVDRLKGEMIIKYNHTEIEKSKFSYIIKISSEGKDAAYLQYIISALETRFLSPSSLSLSLDRNAEALKPLFLSQYNPNGLLIPDNPLFQRLDEIFFQNHTEIRSDKKGYFLSCNGITIRFDPEYGRAASLSKEDLNNLFGLKGFKVTLGLLWMAQASRNHRLNFSVRDLKDLLTIPYSKSKSQEWPPFIEDFLDLLGSCSFEIGNSVYRIIRYNGLDKQIKSKTQNQKNLYSIILNTDLLDYSRAFPIGAGVLKLNPEGQRLHIRIIYKIAQRSACNWGLLQISVRELFQFMGREIETESKKYLEKVLDYLVEAYFIQSWNIVDISDQNPLEGDADPLKERPSDFKRAKSYDSVLNIVPVRPFYDIGPITREMIENAEKEKPILAPNNNGHRLVRLVG